MQSVMIKRCAAAAVLTGVLCGAAAQEHPSVKRPVDLPPSADLTYKIEARKKGISLGGDATVNWRVGAGKYSASNTTAATKPASEETMLTVTIRTSGGTSGSDLPRR